MIVINAVCLKVFPKPYFNSCLCFNILKQVRYNKVLDITRFKDGPQKCIDYCEIMKPDYYEYIIPLNIGAEMPRQTV